MPLQPLVQQSPIFGPSKPTDPWGYYSQNLDSPGDSENKIFNPVKNPVDIAGTRYDPAGFGGLPPPGSSSQAFTDYFNNLDMWNSPNPWKLGGPQQGGLSQPYLQSLYSPQEAALINPLSQSAIDRTVAKHGNGGGDSFLGGMFNSFVHDVIPTAAQYASAAASAYGLAAGGGALVGGGSGGAGGGSSMFGDMAGYQPGVADSIWSDSAIPGLGNVMQSGGTLSNLYKAGNFVSEINGGGSTKTSNPFSWNTSSSGTGGNMADTSISSWANALSPFLSAYNTNRQAGNTADTYNKAYNLITTPSADQQKYRTQLDTLMSNPGSMETSPVYKAMLDQGTNAVNRSAASAGMLGSGNRLADLMKMGQDTASKYYFPQQQALANLAGVQGDSGVRAMGAQSIVNGNTAQNEMQTSMLKDLMGGFGVKSPQQQLIDAMLGKTGGGGSAVNPILNTAKNWFASNPTNPTALNDGSFDTGWGPSMGSSDYANWANDPNAWNNLLAYSGENLPLDVSVNTWG